MTSSKTVSDDRHRLMGHEDDAANRTRFDFGQTECDYMSVNIGSQVGQFFQNATLNTGTLGTMVGCSASLSLNASLFHQGLLRRMLIITKKTL